MGVGIKFENPFSFKFSILGDSRLAEWLESLPLNQASTGSSPARCRYLTGYNLNSTPIYTHTHT